MLVCWCLFDLGIVSSDVLVVLCWAGSGVVLLGNERGGGLAAGRQRIVMVVSSCHVVMWLCCRPVGAEIYSK